MGLKSPVDYFLKKNTFKKSEKILKDVSSIPYDDSIVVQTIYTKFFYL